MQFSKSSRELVVSDGWSGTSRDVLARQSVCATTATRASARADDAKHRLLTHSSHGLERT